LEVIAMVGPLVYDLAQAHVAELRAQRARDRLAAEVAHQRRFRVPNLDVRRLLSPLRPSTGAPAGA
jgi:hypothetical protein